jgi:DNA polymerase-3 subunit delta
MAIPQVSLFLGDEPLLISNKIERLIKESDADEYNVNIYDMDENSISEAVHDALTPPFLVLKKVVIIKNPKFLSAEKSLSEPEKKEFLAYLKQPMESTALIINGCGIKTDERKDTVKQLRKTGYINESRELTEIEAVGWIKRQCALNNTEIRDDAIRLFFSTVGKNLLNAKNELDKLISYVGTGGTITADIVDKIAVKEIQNDVFALSSAILEQKKQRIITLYRDLTMIGNDVNYLFSLVSKSMRDTLLVGIMLLEGYKQSEIAEEMGVSSGRAYYLVKNARSIDLDTVKSYIVKLGDLDYKIKSGQIEAKTGFEFFLFGL